MPSKDTTPLSLYGNDREYLREQERTNELLADIAGETYESPGNIPNGKYILQKRMLDAAQKKNELLESIAGSGGGGGAAKGIDIDYGTDVISLTNKDGDPIQGSGATLPAYGVSFDPTTGGLTLTKNGTAMQGQTVTIPNYGSPVGVTSSSAMTDEGTIYLYEGTTGGGFTNGHFYYYDGSAWADGGEYAAATVQTDKTLLVENRAADAKATGEAVGELKTHLPFEESTSPNLYDNDNPTILNGYLTTASNGIRKFRTGNTTKSLLLQLNANTDYTFSYNNTIGGRHVITLFPTVPNDMDEGEDVTSVGNHVITVGDYSYMHFSTTSNTYLVIYYFNNSDSIEEGAMRSYIMVYEGNELYSYMPYGTLLTLRIKKENINSNGFAGQALMLDANGEDMVWGTPNVPDVIHESDIVLNADAQIDNPASKYYAYRDYDNFPVNKTVRVTRTARIRPQLRITEGDGSGKYEFGPLFIGDQTARQNYVNTVTNVVYNGASVQAIVTGTGGWKPVALEHAPHDYAIIGHETFLNTDGVRENAKNGGTDAIVWTFYSDSGHDYKVQMCATYISASTTDRRPYLSVRTYNGTEWSNWTSLNETGVLHATNAVVDITSYKTITFDDFNNAPANTMYQVDLNCGSAVKHNPAPGRSGVVMTFAWAVSSRHALVQIFYAISNGVIAMYFRYGFQNTGTEFKWTPWERPTTTSIYTAAANVPLVNGNVPGEAIAEPSAGESGTEITLTATAETGYTFDHWEVVSGGVTINDNKFILGSANAEVNAIFVTT